MRYYELLEVSPSASVEVIKSAYKALTMKYHPDVYDGDKDFAEEKMKELNEAFSILEDEEKRRGYNMENGIFQDTAIENLKEILDSDDIYVNSDGTIRNPSDPISLQDSLSGGGFKPVGKARLSADVVISETNDVSDAIANLKRTLLEGDDVYVNPDCDSYGISYKSSDTASTQDLPLGGGFAPVEKTAPSCFTSKMKILLADGTKKSISDCVEGESTTVIDKLTKKKKVAQITTVAKAEANQIIVINGILEVTGWQILYTHNFSPIRARELYLGNYVYNTNKELDQILKLELIKEKTDVYNVTINSDSYICVEDYLVSSHEDKVTAVANLRRALEDDAETYVDENGKVQAYNFKDPIGKQDSLSGGRFKPVEKAVFAADVTTDEQLRKKVVEELRRKLSEPSSSDIVFEVFNVQDYEGERISEWQKEKDLGKTNLGFDDWLLQKYRKILKDGKVWLQIPKGHID